MSIIRLETPSQRACEPCTNGLHIQKFSLHVISNTRYTNTRYTKYIL